MPEMGHLGNFWSDVNILYLNLHRVAETHWAVYLKCVCSCLCNSHFLKVPPGVSERTSVLTVFLQVAVVAVSLPEVRGHPRACSLSPEKPSPKLKQVIAGVQGHYFVKGCRYSRTSLLSQAPYTLKSDACVGRPS